MSPRPRGRSGGPPADLLAAVGDLSADLARLGYQPTLVGGMALVFLGSPRVTRDFDFLVTREAREQEALLELFYGRGFALASRNDERGNILRTIDNERVALSRLRIDRPVSAHFFHRGLGLRVDLLFDFPMSAHEVHARSTRKRLRSYVVHVASRSDLIRMKEIAVGDRGSASDVQDLEFLKRK